MYLQPSDLFALAIALFASLFTLVVAFQRVYVLEKRVFALKVELDWERDNNGCC